MFEVIEMTDLVNFSQYYLIRHKGGKYFKFSYVSKVIAERVRGNLNKDFREQSKRARERLNFQFIVNPVETELLYIQES